VLRRCQLLLRDRAEAEDVLHEVFLRAMRYGGDFPDGDVPLAWLYRVAERCCFSRMEKRTREPVAEAEDLAGQVGDTGGPGRQEASVKVARFLDRLEPSLRHLAVLYFVDDLTQEEAAQELGWSRRTVGKKLKLLEAKALEFQRAEGGPG
jgi:RNA polymerase sigma-70 factor, ECF subfamily